jgi:hypothetical protein
MRIAIVSDLHANLTAWQTVLADLADLKAEQIICLGDVVGYGPHPVELLESVYSVVNVTLMGNHDAAVCGRLPTDTFTPRAAAAVARHRELLAPAALEWLAQLRSPMRARASAARTASFPSRRSSGTSSRPRTRCPPGAPPPNSCFLWGTRTCPAST